MFWVLMILPPTTVSWRKEIPKCGPLWNDKKCRLTRLMHCFQTSNEAMNVLLKAWGLHSPILVSWEKELNSYKGWCSLKHHFSFHLHLTLEQLYSQYILQRHLDKPKTSTSSQFSLWRFQRWNFYSSEFQRVAQWPLVFLYLLKLVFHGCTWNYKDP